MADQADTVELSDEVQETFLLHNRLFQRYAIDNNTYFVPVDEWALQVAWEHPRCEVRGIDITPHHHNPEEGLENLYLDIDNLNMPLVAGGINTGRWTGYIRDIFRSLRPGGWVQMVEIDFNAQSDNGALADNSALRQWSQTYLFAMEQCKNPRAPRRLGGWLRNAGFTDVDERMIPLPMCAWSDNQRDYDIGAANQENVRMLLSSVAIYPFTHYLRYAPSKDMLGRINGNVDGHSSMSITEFHVLVAKARTEAANPALKKAPSIALLDNGIWGIDRLTQMDICALSLVFSRLNWERIPPDLEYQKIEAGWCRCVSLRVFASIDRCLNSSRNVTIHKTPCQLTGPPPSMAPCSMAVRPSGFPYMTLTITGKVWMHICEDGQSVRPAAVARLDGITVMNSTIRLLIGFHVAVNGLLAGFQARVMWQRFAAGSSATGVVLVPSLDLAAP
ncbi:hypothetical protein CHU98_g9766 [Xylaria longipes]|nr:hypothetical protein CHU98_g9766 [Xylaria longipes]